MNGIKVAQLNNGLQYILAPVSGINSVTVLCLVAAGTRYETPNNNGISHFLEHMVFKGTKKYTNAMKIALEIDRVGGLFNAFTGKEYTGFYVKTALDHIDIAMSMVSSLVFEPLLPEKELEIERGVILEEMKMYDDQPQSKVEQDFEEVIFKGSSLAYDTLGTEKVIKSVLKKDFKDYMNLLYVPNRMVVSVAGGIKDDKKMEEMMKKYFGRQGNEVKLITDCFEFKQDTPRQKVVEKKTEQCHLIYGFRAFGRGNEDRYKLAILLGILGGGMSSRLFEEIREKRGLAYYVSCVLEAYIEDGYFGFRAGTNKDNAEKVIELANKEFDKLKKEKVGVEELGKVKEYIKGHFVLGMENSYQVADFFAEDLLMEGKIRSESQVMKAIDKVTASEIGELANKIFVKEKSSLAMIK